MLCAASSQPSSLGGCSCDKTCGFPRTLPLPVLVWPLCFPCMFTLSCPARARMPGIVLCLAVPAHAGPAMSPSPPSAPAHCHVELETREMQFSKHEKCNFRHNFSFRSTFCGSTKRVGPFVLPQKGRPTPSLFFFSSHRFSVAWSHWKHLLERFLGSGFITDFPLRLPCA